MQKEVYIPLLQKKWCDNNFKNTDVTIAADQFLVSKNKGLITLFFSEN